MKLARYIATAVVVTVLGLLPTASAALAGYHDL